MNIDNITMKKNLVTISIGLILFLFAYYVDSKKPKALSMSHFSYEDIKSGKANTLLEFNSKIIEKQKSYESKAIVLCIAGTAFSFLGFAGTLSYYKKNITTTYKKIAGLTKMQSNSPIFYPSIISSLLLFIAFLSFGEFDEEIYLLIKLIVFSLSSYIVFKCYKYKNEKTAFLFMGIAILFNPILQLHFDRHFWGTLDIICSVIFLTAAFLFQPCKEN